jgi:hypothetical protein
MHVLATQLATLEEADVAVDLGQSPADVVVLPFRILIYPRSPQRGNGRPSCCPRCGWPA